LAEYKEKLYLAYQLAAVGCLLTLILAPVAILILQNVDNLRKQDEIIFRLAKT